MTATLVRRPVAVTMLLAAGCLLGAVSYGRLPVELLPFAELPMLVVQVQAPRDSEVDQVESRAVIPLEGAIAGLPGIERIESYVESWGARILVYYDSGVDPGHAYLRLEQRAAAAGAGLDEGTVVQVHKVDTEQLSTRFMALEARGEGGLDRIRHVVDRKVVEELRHVDGVASVAVYGGRRRSIEVRLDEGALRGHGLTAAQVSARIAQGARPRRHLGEVAGAGGRSFVSLVSDYTSMTDLEETVVRDGLRLGQVASVVDGGAERESIAPGERPGGGGPVADARSRGQPAGGVVGGARGGGPPEPAARAGGDRARRQQRRGRAGAREHRRHPVPGAARRRPGGGRALDLPAQPGPGGGGGPGDPRSRC